MYNFVKDIIVKKTIIIKYISTHDMVAYLFTKAVDKYVFLCMLDRWVYVDCTIYDCLPLFI